MNTLIFLCFSLIALFGDIFVLKVYITVGDIVIFTEYARQFTRPLNELSNQFNILLSAVAGAERVFSILDEEVENVDESNAIALDKVKGRFEFQKVGFAYDTTPILKDISFTVQPGKMIA